ncbi:MAG TPA: zinc-dependent alcohol dehydrogenase family protein [Puia sp.]|nr:zinc-dependent alcohol dehydrogenase family protein [Puia sp.]
MKALRFHEAGRLADVLKLEDIPQPAPSPTQVLIEVKASPVNPSDIYFIQGAYRRKPVYPQTAGLEGSGIVVTCGENVISARPGDHVSFRLPGTWSQYCLAEDSSLIRITRDIPFSISSQIGLNPMTAFALLSETSLQKDDWLLLNTASSTVAGIILQMAVAKGINVIALIRDLVHVPALNALGARHVFLQEDPDLVRKIEEITAPKGIRAFFDAIGGKQLENMMPLMSQYATIVCYGNISNGEKAAISNVHLVYRNLTVKGFGIDRWLSLRSADQIGKIYADIAEDLYTKKIVLREIPSVRLEEFIPYWSHLGHPDKVIITIG